MHKIIKAIAVVCVLTLVTLLPSQAVVAQQPEITLEARAALLMDASTGHVLYSKNGGQPLPPASITKIMTMLLALEAVDDRRVSKDDMVTVSQRAWEAGGSRMFLEYRQQVRYSDLLKGIAIISGNDACIAIAEHLYGSEEAFVRRMNERARELGLKNTNFTNSHGIPHPEQKMSALDMAVMSRFFITTKPEGHALYSEPEFTFNAIRQFNRNPLLGRFEGADGLKTGWTGEENKGFNLIATAERDGFRLISVVLGNPSNDSRRRDSEVLLNYGFNNFELVSLAKADEIIEKIPLARGVEREIPVAPSAELEAVVPIGEKENVQLKTVPDEEIVAPVKEGETLGVLQAVLNGELLNETELIAAETVEQAGFFALLLRAIGDFFLGLIQRLFRSN